MLSIIIVNYRSSALILDCLRSLQEKDPALEAELIVVDNASGDGSREAILAAFPSVNWIDMGYNAGFARANNAGMRLAKGDCFLLLNPDTLALDDSISRCYQRLLRSHYAAVGVQQLDAGGAPQISGNFFVRGGLNHLLPIPYWGSLIRWAGYKAKAKVPNVQEAKEKEEVDWISGAFLMVRRESVAAAGMMDEDFFLYAEEVEWCSRLRKLGPLCIYGDLRIVHLEGGSIDKAQNVKERGYYNLYDRKGLQLMVSNHLRVRKQYGTSWFLLLLINYTWGWAVFFFCALFGNLFRLKSPVPELTRVGAFGGNLFRLWSLTPRILSGKPHFYKMF
jgi:GT2 family glycosyltransferase